MLREISLLMTAMGQVKGVIAAAPSPDGAAWVEKSHRLSSARAHPLTALGEWSVI
jgi:hypothetical protein